MTGRREKIGSGNLLFTRVSYGLSFALFLGLSLYLGQAPLIIVVIFAIVTMSLIHLRLDWHIFIESDGFLIENVIGQKKKFGFEMYKGVSKGDVVSRLTGNYLSVDFSDGSSFQFLSRKDPNAMDSEIKELISSFGITDPSQK